MDVRLYVFLCLLVSFDSSSVHAYMHMQTVPQLRQVYGPVSIALSVTEVNKAVIPRTMGEEPTAIVDHALLPSYVLQPQCVRLHWNHAAGAASLIHHTSAGQQRLLVTTYQMVVLLLFNDDVTLTQHQISQV